MASVRLATKAREVDACRSIEFEDCRCCPVRCRSLLGAMEFDTLMRLHRRVPSIHCGFKARDVLYRSGDEFASNIVVFDGWVILYREHADGSRQVFHVALPGDFIPVRFSHGERLDHTAMAVTAVRICAFDREALFDAIVNEPQLSRALTSYEENVLQMCGAHVDCLGRKDAEARIAYFLLHLVDRLNGKPMRNGVPIPFPLTQEQLADWAGLTPVHVNRTLNRLRELELLDCRHRVLTILDWESLARISGYEPRFG